MYVCADAAECSAGHQGAAVGLAEQPELRLQGLGQVRDGLAGPWTLLDVASRVFLNLTTVCPSEVSMHLASHYAELHLCLVLLLLALLILLLLTLLLLLLLPQPLLLHAGCLVAGALWEPEQHSTAEQSKQRSVCTEHCEMMSCREGH